MPGEARRRWGAENRACTGTSTPSIARTPGDEPHRQQRMPRPKAKKLVLRPRPSSTPSTWGEHPAQGAPPSTVAGTPPGPRRRPAVVRGRQRGPVPASRSPSAGSAPQHHHHRRRHHVLPAAPPPRAGAPAPPAPPPRHPPAARANPRPRGRCRRPAASPRGASSRMVAQPPGPPPGQPASNRLHLTQLDPEPAGSSPAPSARPRNLQQPRPRIPPHQIPVRYIIRSPPRPRTGTPRNRSAVSPRTPPDTPGASCTPRQVQLPRHPQAAPAGRPESSTNTRVLATGTPIGTVTPPRPPARTTPP